MYVCVYTYTYVGVYLCKLQTHTHIHTGLFQTVCGNLELKVTCDLHCGTAG